LNVRRVEPLVSRELRFGVMERVRPDGSIEQAPSQNELRELRSQIQKSGAESIAVCLLFSFATSTNEEAVEQELRASNVSLSLSHRILPEFREYERMSTVVVNAYLQPLMQRYLESLRLRLSKNAAAKLFVMQSSGGITALNTAASQPVRTVLSGPAGGAVGALEMGRRAGCEKVISFDMGGTSTDVALLEGRLHVTSEAEIAGLPVCVPMLNIHTVGAGGGSLARIDAGGALRVGPESAGADPGPICYGKGTQPTVTDANLLLGRLRPENFLGGEFRLNAERTRAIFGEWIKRNSLKWSSEELAAGIVRVVNATMEKAIRVVSIEQGYDSRDFALLSFGGAGALHACDLAASLSISRVIVPRAPGALSAYGILSSNVVKDYSRTAPMLLSADHFKRSGKEIEEGLDKLRNTATREYSNEGWKGRIKMECSVDLRYQGQGYELNVPWHNASELLEDFHAAHQRRFGYHHANKRIELVTLRVRASLPQQSGGVIAGAQAKRAPQAETTRAPVYFGTHSVSTQILRRESLYAGYAASGPLIVTEYTATTVVPPGWKLDVDRSGALLISRAKRKRRSV